MPPLMRFDIDRFACRPIKQVSYYEPDQLICLIFVDYQIELWTTADGSPIVKLLQHPVEPGAHLSLFLHDGRLLVSCVDGRLLEYSTTRLKNEVVCSFPGGTPWAICERGSDAIVVASEDGSLVQYNTDDWSLSRHLMHGSKERLVSVCSSDDWLAAGGADGSIHFLSAARNNELQTATMCPAAIVWTLNSIAEDLFVSGDSTGTMSLWQASSATRLSTLVTHLADILCAASVDDEVFCSGTDSRIVQVKIRGDQLIRQTSSAKSFNDIRSICVDKSRRKVITAGFDGCVRTFKLKASGKFPKRRASPEVQPYFPFVQVTNGYFLLRSPDERCQLDLFDMSPARKYLFRTADDVAVQSFDVLQTMERVLYVAYCDDAGKSVVAYSQCADGRLVFKKMALSNREERKTHLVRFGNDCLALASIVEIRVFQLTGSEANLSCTYKVDQHVCFMEVVTARCMAWINLDGSVQFSPWRWTAPNVREDGRMARALCLDLDAGGKGTLALVGYSDRQIVEFNVKKKELSKWCRQTELPRPWFACKDVVLGVQYVKGGAVGLPQSFLLRQASTVYLVSKQKVNTDVLKDKRDCLARHDQKMNNLLFARMIGDALVVFKFTAEAVNNSTPMCPKIKRFME